MFVKIIIDVPLPIPLLSIILVNQTIIKEPVTNCKAIKANVKKVVLYMYGFI